MGNNNATASLTEEESSKYETNGMSPPLKTVSVDTTRDQEFLEGEEIDGDEEKESFPDGGKIDKGTTGSEPQSKELVEDPKVKNVEEEDMHQSGLESLVIENHDHLQKQTSGVGTVTEGEEQCLSMIGTESVVSKLVKTESGNDENPCAVDEIVVVSPSLYENVESEEEKMIDEPREEIFQAEEVVKLDQETGLEQRTGYAEIEPQEILNLDYRVDDDNDDDVSNEGLIDHVIPKLGSQESNAIQESGPQVYKEHRVMEIRREMSLNRMSRCRSLPVSHNSRVMVDLLVPQVVSEVAFPSRNKIGLEESNKAPESLLVACIGSNKAQETSDGVTESNKDAELEMRSPSSDNDLRIEERSDALTEKTPSLCQDKSETYEATIYVEEKTMMLKRSESENIRSVEVSLGFSKKFNERSEADDSFKETKGICDDNLLDKKASSSFMKGRVQKRSKSPLLGACLCCTTTMN